MLSLYSVSDQTLVPIVEKAETPCEVVSVDLTGPPATLHGQVLLTMIDYYSCYPEVFILKRGDKRDLDLFCTEWHSSHSYQ